MKPREFIIKTITLWTIVSVVHAAFLNHESSYVAYHKRYVNSQALYQSNEKLTQIEVCGGKDCKRNGGGKPLVNNILKILQETSSQENFIVEGCDCQGECGYGPNVLVNGQIINNVRGKDAILQALGIQVDVKQSVQNE